MLGDYDFNLRLLTAVPQPLAANNRPQMPPVP